MKKPTAPCKDCETRYLGCHAECDRYKKFTKESELFREEKYKRQEENRVQNDIENRRKKLAATGQLSRRRRHGNS